MARRQIRHRHERMTEVRSLRQKLLGLFSDTGFRGPVLSLMSGSGITLAAAYFAQPILTRIYGPEAFGVSDYFVGVMAILTPVASLRYEDAVMTPERDRDAGHVIWLSAILSMTTVVDRKSTRLNSSHVAISYAVFC